MIERVLSVILGMEKEVEITIVLVVIDVWPFWFLLFFHLRERVGFSPFPLRKGKYIFIR